MIWRISVRPKSRKSCSSTIKLDLFTCTLVILSVFFNYFTGHVQGKPGSGEPLYLELEQDSPSRNVNISNSPVHIQPEKFPVESARINSDNIPESIRTSLSSFCEKCTESQRKKVEQILLLLYNINNVEEEDQVLDDKHENFSSFSSTPSSSSLYNQHGGINKPLKKVKKKSFYDHEGKKKVYSSKKRSKFHATSLPKSSAFVPTPEIQYYHNPPSNEYLEENHGVIQLPTTSTTPAPSSPVLPSRVLSFYPRYKSVTRSAASLSAPFLSPRGISTTVSSALGPVQSVEMPTPPMPPTTTGPIYFYYLSSPRSSSSASGSSSVQPPTTPVVESSLASRPTTIEP